MTEERILLLDNKIRNEIMRYMPSCEVLQGLVDFFSIFSDTTRIRIVSALAISEMCVNDICTVLGINQTTVSHQLRTSAVGGRGPREKAGQDYFLFDRERGGQRGDVGRREIPRILRREK